MSATIVSPAAPPATPAANLILPACALSRSAFIAFLTAFLLPILKAVPVCLACNAFFASLLPNLNPTVLGTPIETRACVSLPAPCFSAISSKGFKVSKNCSTPAAVFVSKPRSMSSAAKENIPSGTFNTPDAIPAAPAVYQLVSYYLLLVIMGQI